MLGFVYAEGKRRYKQLNLIGKKKGLGLKRLHQNIMTLPHYHIVYIISPQHKRDLILGLFRSN